MYIFYGHGGSGNHGCEAIVRSTVKMLNQPVCLFSSNTEQDIQYGIDKICTVLSDQGIPLTRGSKEWIVSAVQTKLTGKIDMQIRYRKKALLDKVNKKNIYLSIGGDNYCYPGTEVLAAERNVIQRRGAKTVLWGCSVEPKLLENPQIAKDLGSYDLITARESISYEALRKVNPNTVLASDPAFTLDKKLCPLPKRWKKGNTIGINASPLILQSAKNGKLVYEAYKELIAEILETTDCAIALIPHVVWRENDDREPLKALYKEFKDSERVILLEDYNCLELKGFISQCRMFIGARTHATIAAYSTCVPTLVLGYSVKSKGIAKDLFGTDSKYVLPVQNMKNYKELANAFWWFYDHEDEIRSHLKKNMPEYVQKAFLASEAVKKLCI